MSVSRSLWACILATGLALTATACDNPEEATLTRSPSQRTTKADSTGDSVRYQCVSAATKKNYLVIPAYGEIQELDDAGNMIDMQDSMTPNYKFIETQPPRTVITFIHEEGDTVATIQEIEGQPITMSYDGDDQITCTKTKKNQNPVVKYDCRSDASEKRYMVIPSYGEIQELDDAGKMIDMLDSMTAKYQYIETQPPKTVITFVHEEGDTVATLVEVQGKGVTMSFDGDDSFECRKIAE
jgi:hypothetical protein